MQKEALTDEAPCYLRNSSHNLASCCVILVLVCSKSWELCTNETSQRWGSVSGIYRQECTCGSVLWALWLNGECVITGTKQASFFVVSAGDSSDGKDVFQSTLPANGRRQYWKLIIYKYLISWSTFMSGNYSYFSYQGTALIFSLGFGFTCVLKSDFHNFRDFESSLNSWYRSGGVMLTIHPFYQIGLVSWSHTCVWLKLLLLVGLLVVVKPSAHVCVYLKDHGLIRFIY